MTLRQKKTAATGVVKLRRIKTWMNSRKHPFSSTSNSRRKKTILRTLQRWSRTVARDTMTSRELRVRYQWASLAVEHFYTMMVFRHLTNLAPFHQKSCMQVWDQVTSCIHNSTSSTASTSHKSSRRLSCTGVAHRRPQTLFWANRITSLHISIYQQVCIITTKTRISVITAF